MNMDLLRFRQNALKRVWGPIYVGPGFSFDRYYAIEDRSLDLSATPAVVTSHYAYSQITGFGTRAYTASGASLNVIYDSRDSTINAYRGSYASISYQWNPTFLGSSQSSSLISGEYRTYVGLSSEVPRNVLAFWVAAQATVSGNLPYLALPASGWDSRIAPVADSCRAASAELQSSMPRRSGGSGSLATDHRHLFRCR
jgi:Omp85 superfamily domain